MAVSIGCMHTQGTVGETGCRYILISEQGRVAGMVWLGHGSYWPGGLSWAALTTTLTDLLGMVVETSRCK